MYFYNIIQLLFSTRRTKLLIMMRLIMYVMGFKSMRVMLALLSLSQSLLHRLILSHNS